VISNSVKVIARANAKDKHTLTQNLRAIKFNGDDERVVAVTGEGFADVAALKAANVGFAMGSGVPAAKAAAKVILINDDISSIIKSVLWGRNIYCNAKKYLQF
jgi:P-type Ca2+ transporter type 2C